MTSPPPDGADARSGGTPGEGVDALALHLRRAFQSTRDANVAMARSLGMGANDFAALDLVISGGVNGPADLARRLGMTTASATALIDRLEAAGHVERRRDPADRRRVTLAPTDHAISSAWAVIAPVIAAAARATERLTPEQREAVRAYLDAITQANREHVHRLALDSGAER